MDLPSRKITKAFLLIISLLITKQGLASSDVYVGRIAVWHGEQPVATEMPLVTKSSSGLGNDLIRFESAPADLKADEKNCFCFPLSDERFAYVHAFYYATEQLRHYNQILKSLGLSELRNVPITLRKVVFVFGKEVPRNIRALVA